MKTQALLRLASHEAFWYVRALTARLTFRINQWGFGVLRRRDLELADSRAFRSVLRATAPQLFFAIGTSILVQAANPWLGNSYKAFGWATPEDGIYGTLLAGVASIGAVFIGLYYAGLTAVGSSVYARLPENIRELLVRERLGNAYMRFLAFLTFFCVCMLSLRVLGYEKVNIVIPVISLLSGVGIFGFIRLGQRALHLFDPVTISDATFLELQELTKQVSVRGFRWRDPSFQHYAHQRAIACLGAIESLRRLCSSESYLAEQSQLSLIGRLVGFLVFYIHAKGRIPADSRWFGRAYEHPAWYASPDSTVGMAHQTGTAISPEEVVKGDWVEDRLTKIILSALSDYLANGSDEHALRVIGLAQGYLVALSRSGEVPAAALFLRDLNKTALDRVLETGAPTDARLGLSPRLAMT